MKKIEINSKSAYSVKEGEKYFDWYAFLKQEVFTQDELDDAAGKASDWVTCACGNQCAILDRNEWGEPEDQKLAEIGTHFADSVENMAYAFGTLSELQEDLSEEEKISKGDQRSLDRLKGDFARAHKDAVNTLNAIEKHSTKLIQSKISVWKDFFKQNPQFLD